MSSVTKKIQAGQRFVVLGLGVSGCAAMKFLVQHEAQVAVSDTRSFEELSEGDQEYIQEHSIPFEEERHTLSF